MISSHILVNRKDEFIDAILSDTSGAAKLRFTLRYVAKDDIHCNTSFK